jgi:hypothetical protein
MGTFLASSLLVVPIIAWMTGTSILDARGDAANPLRAARDLPKFPKIRFFWNHYAAGFLFERSTVDGICGREAANEVNS